MSYVYSEKFTTFIKPTQADPIPRTDKAKPCPILSRISASLKLVQRKTTKTAFDRRKIYSRDSGSRLPAVVKHYSQPRVRLSLASSAIDRDRRLMAFGDMRVNGSRRIRYCPRTEAYFSTYFRGVATTCSQAFHSQKTILRRRLGDLSPVCVNTR